MKVIDLASFGGPEVLTVAERPLPQTGRDELLIKVAGAGLNHADLLQRRGKYPPPPGAPSNPGMEISGTVAAVGENVSEFAVGDAVCALVQGGGYSQYCVAPVGQCLPVPAGLTLIQAAALPEACFTVWSNVFEFGRLQPGESFLVHGGSSGIGATAIQLAKARGSRVFATAGSEEKCRFCTALGAERAINYRTADFVHELQAATQDKGVDVILDMVGGNYLPRNIELLATQGRLVTIATLGGSTGMLDLRAVMGKRLTITGSTLRPRSPEFKQQMKQQLLQHVWPLFASGQLRPIVDRVFAWTQAPQAHAYMEEGGHQGKIVLEF